MTDEPTDEEANSQFNGMPITMNEFQQQDETKKIGRFARHFYRLGRQKPMGWEDAAKAEGWHHKDTCPDAISAFTSRQANKGLKAKIADLEAQKQDWLAKDHAKELLIDRLRKERADLERQLAAKEVHVCLETYAGIEAERYPDCDNCVDKMVISLAEYEALKQAQKQPPAWTEEDTIKVMDALCPTWRHLSTGAQLTVREGAKKLLSSLSRPASEATGSVGIDTQLEGSREACTKLVEEMLRFMKRENPRAAQGKEE